MKKNLKIKLPLPFLTGLVIVVLLFGTVYTAIVSGLKGGELNSIELDRQMIEDEVKELSYLVVSTSSLLIISKEASELGMVKPQNFLYLTQVEPVAQR